MELLQSASSVHAYWPIRTNREVDIRPVSLSLRKSGKQIILPVVDGNLLRHRIFLGENDLEPGAFGEMHPRSGAEVEVTSLDVILVPAMAVDRNGNRLGYGAGFYDRFLSRVDAVLIAPVFSEQIVDFVPVEKHDIPVDFIVSDEGAIDISRV